MRHVRPPARLPRLAGLFVVLALHAALLYGLWRQQPLPPPAAAATLFVSLLQQTPEAEPPRPQVPQPPAQPVKAERRAAPPPPQLAAQAPALQPGEAVAPPPPAAPQPVAEARAEPAPPPPAGPVLLDGELAVACPQRSAPAYPPYSRRLGEEGKVLLRVELDEEGRVDRAAVKTSSGFARLDDAALRAVKAWHCNPARRDGIAQRAVALQPFNFVLEGR